MSVVRSVVKKGLGAMGYRVVRVPVSPASGSTPPSPTPDSRFFPIGRVHPDGWPIPPELAAGTLPWQRVLVEVYQDSASWPASLSPEAGMLIHALVRNIQPRVIVETGTCLGVSTIWMAAALASLPRPGTRALHTFDDFMVPSDKRLAASPLFQDRRRTVEERLRRAHLARFVRFHAGDSKVRLVEARNAPAAPAEADKRGQVSDGVQFAFIDGDHSIHGAAGDLRAVEPVLQVGGYVLLHDVFPEVCSHPGPRYLLDHLAESVTGMYETCHLYTAPTNYGMALLRRVG